MQPALPNPITKKETRETREIFSALEQAYDALVKARKVAGLSNHKSYCKIGQCLDQLEKAFDAICPIRPKRKS
jgi:hypothetical protein